MNWFSACIVLTLLLVAVAARAETADDQYLKIIGIVDRADVMNEKKSGDLGKAKYLEAATALQNLKKQYPTWNVKVVSYRLNYVSEKMTALSQTNSVAATATDQPGAKPQTKAASGSAQVKLLAPGAEPRKVLRLQVKPGDKQTLTTTVTTAMDMGPAGAMKMPAVKMPMDVTVKSVSAEGDITYEVVTGETTIADDPGGNPAITDALKTRLGSVAGLTSAGAMSSRGLGKAAAMKAPTDADAQTRQALEQMKESLANAAIPLPEEAVGAGAKWEIKQPIRSQGLTINQTMTYQLVSVEGDRLNIKSSVVQSAANQKVENPQMPGMKFDLTKMTGTGTGNTTLDLTQLLPSKAALEVHTELSLGMNLGGQKQTMTMKMDVNTLVESK